MENLINSTKDFKIIPVNYKSAGEFELIDIKDKSVKARLILDKPEDIKDYNIGNNVEVFGVNKLGLVYFEVELSNVENNIISFSIPDDYSLIQRREYSRVHLEKGRISFIDSCVDVISVEDISAGGAKLILSESLNIENDYNISILLSNNMNINCDFRPIRVQKDKEDRYIVSGRFVNLENMDRIVLVQYAFKTKMELQNIEDN